MDTNNTEKSLSDIARQRHTYQYVSGKYDFLDGTKENVHTYTLGFHAGMEHCVKIWEIQIEALQAKVKELEKQNIEYPTLNTQP